MKIGRLALDVVLSFAFLMVVSLVLNSVFAAIFGTRFQYGALLFVIAFPLTVAFSIWFYHR